MDITAVELDIPFVPADMDTNLLVLMELLAIAEKETLAAPHVPMLVKLEDLLMLKIIAKPEFMNSAENKDISAMLPLVDFTNA